MSEAASRWRTVGEDFRGDPIMEEVKPATPPKPPSIRVRAEKAVSDQHHAAGLRRIADEDSGRDPTGARFMRKDAAHLEAKADAALSISAYTSGVARNGNGGELVPLPEMGSGVLAAIVSEPADALAHSASTQRLELSAATDTLSLGLDVANGIKARNAVEKMLSQQAAALHKLGMEFAAQAGAHLQKARGLGASTGTVMAQNIEASRAASAAIRLFGGFNEAVLTVRRHRSGGQQVVKVIHQQVSVGQGGQAVVAGSIKGGRGGKRLPRLVPGGK
jgi:hypothetical protein